MPIFVVGAIPHAARGAEAAAANTPAKPGAERPPRRSGCAEATHAALEHDPTLC